MNVRIPLIRFRSSVVADTVRACARVRRAFDRIVYDTVALEGNPLIFEQVRKLLVGESVDEPSTGARNQVLIGVQ